MGAATADQGEILAAAAKSTVTHTTTAWRSGRSDATDSQAPDHDPEYTR